MVMISGLASSTGLRVPIAELLLDHESGVREERRQRVRAEEPKGTATRFRSIPSGARIRGGEPHHVAGDRRLDLRVERCRRTVGGDELDPVFGSPPLPLAGERVAGLEREDAATCE